MSKITPEKTHALLEKLTNYVTSKIATKEEVNDQIAVVTHKLSSVDNQFETVNDKIDKLAEYVMNEVPTKKEMNHRFEQVDRRFESIELRLDDVEEDLKETKKDVKSILNGMDNTVKDMEILRTEQIAIHSGLRRMENRVDGLERKRA